MRAQRRTDSARSVQLLTWATQRHVTCGCAIQRSIPLRHKKRGPGALLGGPRGPGVPHLGSSIRVPGGGEGAAAAPGGNRSMTGSTALRVHLSLHTSSGRRCQPHLPCIRRPMVGLEPLGRPHPVQLSRPHPAPMEAPPWPSAGPTPALALGTGNPRDTNAGPEVARPSVRAHFSTTSRPPKIWKRLQIKQQAFLTLLDHRSIPELVSLVLC